MATEIEALIAEARDFCLYPNIHFHYTDGPRVMSALADALEQSLRSQAGVSEAVAVLKYDKNTPGNENEMPKVVSCNWLDDGKYRVYLRPAPIEITEAAERAFKDGLAYGSNVRNADPDIAWGHSAIRAALQGETN